MSGGNVEYTNEVGAEVYEYLTPAGVATVPGAGPPLYVGANWNANGNYAAVTYFEKGPAAGITWRIERLLVYIEDGGAIQANGYGAGAALANGILVQVRDNDGLVYDLTNTVRIYQSRHWQRLCYDFTLAPGTGGTLSLHGRWTFGKRGAPLRLKGSTGERLSVVLNDNLTFLSGHAFLIQGEVEEVLR